MHKNKTFNVAWHVFAVLIFLSGVSNLAVAGPKEEVTKIDQEVIDLKNAIAFNKKVEANLKAKVRQSRNNGLKNNQLNWKNLESQGLQGIGVVGPGKNKPQVVQDIINAAERGTGELARFNPKSQLLAGHLRTALATTNERKSMTKKRRAELGLSADEELPNHDKKLIEEIGNQRSLYATEAVRSKILQQLLQNKIDKNEKRRSELVTKLTPQERKKAEKNRKDKLAENGGETEKQPPKEEKKPPFDDTNLRASFARFERLIDQQTNMFKSVSNACKTVPSRDQIKNTADKLLQTPFKDLPLNVALLRKEKILRARLLAILREMEGLENSTFADADTACKTTGTNPQRLAPIRAAGARTQSAGDRAKGLRASAKKITAELVASHAKKLGNANVDYTAIVIRQEYAAIHQCRKIGDGAQSARQLYNKTNSESELEQAAALASSNLKEAKEAKFVNADVYQFKFDRYAKYQKAARNNVTNLADCEKRQKYVSEQCNSMGVRFAAKTRAQLKHQSRLIEGLLNNRAAELATANKAMSRINRLTARIYTAVIATNSCVADAESKVPSQPDPQTVAAAAQLGNTSTLTCNSSDIDQRIAQLRLPKYSKLPDISQRIAQLQAKKALLERAKAQINEAKVHFGESRPGSTRRSLEAARKSLTQLNGAPPCPVLQARISKGESQTAELDRILSAARGALNSCNPRQLQAAVRAIGRKRNVPAKLARARARMERQLGVLRLLRNASRLYNSGDLKGARRLILQARNLRSKSGSRDCPALDQRVDNALTAVARQQGQQEQARQAANSCDTLTLADIQRSLKKKRGKFVKSFNYQITKSMKVCKEKDKDRQAERDRKEREESLRAAGQRQATCREKYGVGYRPGKVDNNGKYYCLPSKRTANAWCQNNNTGNGWRAVKFTGKGGYSCRQSRRVVASAARADCRRQYGSRYSHTVVKRSGRYTCHFCPRGHYARKGRCYNRRATARRTPKYTCPRGYYLKGRRCYSRQNAADVARVIGGILGAISNNRRQPRARGCPRGFVPDGRKCYRCGAGTVARNGSCVSVSNRRRIQKRRKSRSSCGKTIYRGGIPMTDTC